jgi:hypothetical protein
VSEMGRELGDQLMRSLRELGLRCRAVGLLSQIQQMAAIFQEPTTRIPDMFRGSLRSMDDISARVYDAIARSLTIERGSTCGIPEDQPARYIGSNRDEAHRLLYALTLLACDPDLMHCMRAGISWTHDPRIPTACTNITMLLEITLPIEPAPATFGAAPDPQLSDNNSIEGRS